MRAHRPLGFAALALLVAIVATGCKRDAGPSDAAVAEKARAALAPFKSTLKAELGRGLAESPEKAIAVCAERAPQLARDASREGVVVGRSASRLRNQANAPRPWLAPVLDELARAPSGSDASRVVRLEDGRRGYAEAIWVGPQCLVCHGEGLAPSVSAALDARYPGDRARGFRAGDFRGVFWVELDPAALR